MSGCNVHVAFQRVSENLMLTIELDLSSLQERGQDSLNQPGIQILLDIELTRRNPPAISIPEIGIRMHRTQIGILWKL